MSPVNHLQPSSGSERPTQHPGDVSMAYGALMRQAWQLVWGHKFLIVIAAAPSALSLLAAGLNSATGILGSVLIVAGAVLSQGCLIMGILQLLDTGQSGYRLAWDAAWPKKWR